MYSRHTCSSLSLALWCLLVILGPLFSLPCDYSILESPYYLLVFIDCSHPGATFCCVFESWRRYYMHGSSRVRPITFYSSNARERSNIHAILLRTHGDMKGGKVEGI